MAAVARNGVIGRDGRIPWHLRDDMVRFRRVTMGHVLVMGRLTYESIGRPLPGRTTIVVTRRTDWRADQERPPGLLVAPSLASALATAESLDGETFVQGGASLYAEALTVADRLLITWVDDDPLGDTFFPEVDWSQWCEQEREPFRGGVWATYVRRVELTELVGERL